MDFVVPGSARKLALIEAKASSTPSSSAAGPIVRLAHAIGGREVEGYVVHARARESIVARGVRPGVKALVVNDLWRVL